MLSSAPRVSELYHGSQLPHFWHLAQLILAALHPRGTDPSNTLYKDLEPPKRMLAPARADRIRLPQEKEGRPPKPRIPGMAAAKQDWHSRSRGSWALALRSKSGPRRREPCRQVESGALGRERRLIEATWPDPDREIWRVRPSGHEGLGEGPGPLSWRPRGTATPDKADEEKPAIAVLGYKLPAEVTINNLTAIAWGRRTASLPTILQPEARCLRCSMLQRHAPLRRCRDWRLRDKQP